MPIFPDWLDQTDGSPTTPGWHATLQCWDAAEGIFPGAHYWDGKAWNEGTAIRSFSPMTFADKDAAKDWAYAHDVEA